MVAVTTRKGDDRQSMRDLARRQLLAATMGLPYDQTFDVGSAPDGVWADVDDGVRGILADYRNNECGEQPAHRG
eukprot:9233270-Prorocentrum_lima.AAC.1